MTTGTAGGQQDVGGRRVNRDRAAFSSPDYTLVAVALPFDTSVVGSDDVSAVELSLYG